ncbi:MAG: chromosome segregation protein SMC, partial [Candidatus Nealsonbacteria bacterium]|nr:chromosome segregation protein SMC [Candidatus Nealsonbacteria bacterium]
GMGTQAYSVIEQGKVDVLLQSSPRDRRLIFEEAAGISRFKARKLESLRRLDRVEQNLLRLSDIVDEVESRLRSVRLQAGKAHRYKEYTDRLQELRTQAGLVDWRRLTDRLDEFESKLQAARDDRDARVARTEVAEARLLQIESEIGDTTESIRRSEARIAANRERIASNEATIEHERNRSRDLEHEITRHRRQLLSMNARAGDLQQQLQETEQEVEEAEERHRQIAVRLAEGERNLTGVMTGLDQIRGENEQRRVAYVEQMRCSAVLGSQAAASQSQLTAAAATRDRSRSRTGELDRQSDALTVEMDDLRRQFEESSRRLQQCQDLLTAAEEELAAQQHRLTGRQNELGQLLQRYSGVAERAVVLEELQRRQEGVSAGVKEVLAAARSEPDGPYRPVCGLVADLLDVSVEIAPLVETALADAAQYVVVEPDDRLLDHLQQESQRLAGRVGFIRLDASPEPPHGEPVDLQGHHGVLGRADRFVETEPRFAALTRRLLGRTWIVEKLADAIRLAESAGRGQSFVSLAGEMLSADGTLVVGPRHGTTGLISRRSQLEALKIQQSELEAKIAQAERAVEELQQQIAAQQQQVRTRLAEHRLEAEAAAEHRATTAAARQRREELDRQRTVMQSELRAAEVQHETASRELDDTRAKRTELDATLIEMESRLAELDEQIDRLEGQRQKRDRETTQVKVDLAKSEERLRNLHARLRQLEEGRLERGRAIDENSEQLVQRQRRADQSRWSILHAESEVAELFLRKEQFAAETVALIEQRESLRQQRTDLSGEVHKIRQRIHKLEERIHAEDLSASEVRHDRNTLAGRLREDYGIELAELEHEATEEEQYQREQTQQEIEELRRRIGNLGHVNIEALEELEELDGRYTNLSGQYRDLVDAKASLEKIIDRINTDSRRLFSETLEIIRGHFQRLFRDLFGGGYGDIVLDDDVDILESGIEIVARPPGKEPRNISLLSGGEKTLTCVALLLAVFRSRPSPFCVLDEVDAALDEANIDRFTQVMQDFLTWTQFIIVTHSKKTMTCADTIYGVTMQESGISKQVSVRFEDVSEDGEILTDRTGDDDTQAA